MERKLKILAVDDEERNLKLLRNLLQHRYDLCVATNGKQALIEIESFMPDLVLLDIIMPALDGIKVCEMIKKSDRTKHIPVIFLSGKTMTADVIRGLKAGASDYVQKPYSQVELLARIHTQLELTSLRKKVKEQESELFHLRRKLGEI